jgi:hypothetical protein
MFHQLFQTPQSELPIFTLAAVHSLYSAPVDCMLWCNPGINDYALITSAQWNAVLYMYRNLDLHLSFLSPFLTF